jgi:hypothetical protein
MNSRSANKNVILRPMQKQRRTVLKGTRKRSVTSQRYVGLSHNGASRPDDRLRTSRTQPLLPLQTPAAKRRSRNGGLSTAPRWCSNGQARRATKRTNLNLGLLPLTMQLTSPSQRSPHSRCLLLTRRRASSFTTTESHLGRCEIRSFRRALIFNPMVLCRSSATKILPWSRGIFVTT